MAISQKPNRSHRPPVAILVDRSGDLLAGRSLVHLEPDDRYQTTDSRVLLTARMLSRYDVLAIAGQGRMAYSRHQTDAIAQFVRRGGGLLLAGVAGVFERYTGRSVEEMAVAAIGRRFGIEFLSPAQAAGRTDLNPDLVAGYPAASIVVRRRGPMRGLRRQDVFLDRWSPLRANGRAAVLLSHRRTGEAAALSVRFGRGNIVAVGGLGSFCENGRACRALIDHLAAGRPSRSGAARIPCEVFPKYTARRTGSLEVRHGPGLADRSAAVLRIGRRLLPHFQAMAPTRKAANWPVELNGSCVSLVQWSWYSNQPAIHLGVDVPDAELAFALGGQLAEVAASRGPVGMVLRDTVLGREAVKRFAGLTAMRWAGFDRDVERLGEALDRESRRRFKGLDAGRFYYYRDAPGLWIWRELAQRYGQNLLERFFRAVPEKCKWEAAPQSVFTQLDLAIHFLSRAVKDDLYPWFARIGATVHPLPRGRFGSAAFKRGVRRYLRRRLEQAEAPASERADAVEALIACQEQDKRPPGYAVRQLRSKHPAARLVAAARLAKARDSRGLDELEVLAGRRKDPALAAIAALRLVEQGRGKSAGRLAKLAPKLDHRFQLDAGYQLRRIGDPRAARFSLEGIGRAEGAKAARLETDHRGGVAVHPTVDGQRVAMVFSRDLVAHMPGNTHVSMFFVDWVHTGAKFRRKGLSRLAMERSLNGALARRCSCAGLGTGTRNVAHAMYRSFGFVDARASEALTCELGDVPPAARIKGVKVRPYRPGDERAMADLFNACYGESFAAVPARAIRPAPGATTLLARRGGRLVGYLTALPGKPEASIRVMAVKSGEKREGIARALVGSLHRLLARRGAKKVSVWYATEALGPLLQPLGYRSRRTGGVAMFALLNLPQFLREIAPLLERRIGENDFTGTISLLGRKHRAALKIDRGRVSVLDRPGPRPDIALAGADETITRIVGGIETPFEAYLQLHLQITPMLDDNVRGLLERLFPRLEVFTWIW